VELILDRRQVAALMDALLDAFPTMERLDDLSRLALADPLARFAEGPLENAVKGVVDRAQVHGRLPRLVRRACALARGNTKLRRFEGQEAGLGAFRVESLDNLEAAVGPAIESGRLPEVVVSRCADEARPATWVFPAAEENETVATTFQRYADDLSTATRAADGTHPLTRFAATVAEALEGEHRAAVHAWLAENGAARAPAARRRSLGGVALFVKCAPPPGGAADDVRVTAWMWPISTAGEPLKPERLVHETAMRVTDVPQVLATARQDPRLAAALERAGGNSKLTVELCVPEPLFAADVEAWRYTFCRIPVVLCMHHPVVLRSYERIYDDEFRSTWGDWSARWARVKAAPPGERWVIRAEAGAAPDAVLAQATPDVVCVATASAPGTELVNASLFIGAPALLWIRRPDPRAAEVLAGVVRGRPGELPGAVHAARSAALKANTDEPGRSLVLVWDDYDRLPPDRDGLLQAP
jgi:hypothetical protein